MTVPTRIQRLRRTRFLKEWAAPVLMLACILAVLIFSGAKFVP